MLSQPLKYFLITTIIVILRNGPKSLHFKLQAVQADYKSGRVGGT